MGRIQFDYSGSVDADFGVTESQIASLAPQLIQCRDAIMGAEQPQPIRFVGLPQELLDGYTQHRDDSELGRIFSDANRLHDQVDAIVVLGSGGSILGAQAIMDACCDPFHNELSRGDRGSKPRMYFAGDSLDNDTSSALLHRLGRDLTATDPVIRRWALVTISKSGQTLETGAATRQFLAALEDSLSADAASLLPEFVLPVTSQGSPLFDLAQAIGCKNIFSIPSDVSGRFSILSSAGVLPAAILGLDCIQLLEGAAAMSKHFQSAPPDKNLVMQFVAVNHLLEVHRGINIRVMSLWCNALEAVGHWYAQLVSQALGRSASGPTPLTVVNSRDLHNRHQQHLQGRCDKVFNLLTVKNHRADPWKIGRSDRDQDGLNVLSERALPDLMTTALAQTTEDLRAAGRPSTEIRLPEIDTHTLGQLFQMLMLATALQAHLNSIEF